MIRFETGQEVQTIGVFAGAEMLRGHRRDVATITTTGIDYAAAAALFVDGARWYIVEPGQDGAEQVFDWTDYGVAGAITDNRDGTLIVKMGKNNTLEQDLQDQLSEQQAQISEQEAVIAILAGEEEQYDAG